jgi:hypothetical protein
MHMVLTIPISDQTEAKLKAKAAVAGVDLQTYAARTLERIASRPALEEVLAPLRSEVDASGISEDALSDLLESAKHEMRAQRRAQSGK